MKMTSDGYYKNQHSCFLLQYHLVLVTKYRHPVLQGEIEEYLVQYTRDYFKKQDLNILELNCSEDHIHILFEAVPQMNLSNFVNAYKTASSRMVRKNFGNELKQYYWKPYFWSLSYFIGKYSLQGTTQGNGLTGGLPPVRFSM